MGTMSAGGWTLNLTAELHLGPLFLKLELQAREGALAVTGPSGSGKTTLLRILAGLEPRARGRVEVAGEDVLFPPYFDPR